MTTTRAIHHGDTEAPRKEGMLHATAVFEV